ncbi:hypothetical protein, partial [Nocardia brasiliensis]|uniref:hypothetical protein n=1 Tax=Nocardia brasiliensis TaxID=37326 RepID=UPI002453DC14
ELDAWSNRFARLLLSRGVGREVFVVLALTRSLESVVAVWALAKSGAAPGGGARPPRPRLRGGSSVAGGGGRGAPPPAPSTRCWPS